MRILLTILFGLIAFCAFGQNETGTVSYISSQNVYVKFASTNDISIGDTLFFKKENTLSPALLVTSKSSISCVCSLLVDIAVIKVSDEVIFQKKEIIKPEETTPEKPVEKNNTPIVSPPQIAPQEEEEELLFKQKIKGRVSVASYSNISEASNRNRMRYAFSFAGNNLNNSRFSTDNYITFRHTLGEWGRGQNNFADALKIYSFSVKYDLDRSSSLTLGRKINPRISSMGAIDGLQLEKGFGGQFKFGAIAGSRPDYSDYSINFNLMQAGAYISHVSEKTKKYQQSTLGFIEQRNSGNVDRRFVYFQHSNSLAKNLNLFTSFEFDLYEKINNEQKNKVSLTNLYSSLRYRFSRKFSVSASYDTRKNIVYYESYKNTIDSLFENETRQGLRFGFNLRPHKYITWGVNSSMRFQKDKGNISRNLNSYISISRIPVIHARASLTANFLETGYIKSGIYGIRLTRDLMKKKLSAEAYYRWVDYNYKTSEFSTHQNIVGASCSFRLMKKLGLYIYYEGIFSDQSPTQTRLNTKIIQRF